MIDLCRHWAVALCLIASAMRLTGVETDPLPTVRVKGTWPGVAVYCLSSSEVDPPEKLYELLDQLMLTR